MKTDRPLRVVAPPTTIHEEPADGSRLAVTLTVSQLRELVFQSVADAMAETSPRSSEGPLTLSGADMGRRLGVSRTSMHGLRLRGCPSVRLGDAYRYEPERVLEWLRTSGGEK